MWIWFILLALVLLFITRMWPGTVYLLLGMIIVLSAGIFLWMRHVENQRAGVIMSVVYDTAACPSDRPVRVSITNTLDKTLEQALFSLHATLPGYSSTVTPYTYKQYRSDKILGQGESHSSCYPVPLMTRRPGPGFNPEKLDWSANVDSVTFRAK